MKLSVRIPDPRLSRGGMLLLVEGLAVGVLRVLKVEYVIHALSRGQDSIPLSVESLDFFLPVEGLGIGVLLFLEYLDEAG
jgi:hypothetical protein